VTAELLAKLGAVDVTSVRDQIRAAHAELPEGKCQAWRHQMRFSGKEGGCDIHPVEDE
jgi:hypothetical protein